MLASILLVINMARATGPGAAGRANNMPLSAATVADFENLFLAGLDHNRDGSVSVHEAAGGLRAMQERQRGPANPHLLPQRIDRFLCAPSIEATSFVDCVGARARAANAAGLAPAGLEVVFSEELSSFVGGLDDEIPAHLQNSQSCDTAVLSHHVSCSELLRTGHCRLSCGHHEKAHFRKRAAKPSVRCHPQPAVDLGGDGSASESASASWCVCTQVGLLQEGFPRARRAQTSDEWQGGYANLLVSSDWHLEPWYDTTGAGSIDGDTRISRFNPDEATLATYGQCRAGPAPGAPMVTPCPTTGEDDPPISFGVSHFAAFSRMFSNDSSSDHRVFFFCGDTQAHGALNIWLCKLQMFMRLSPPGNAPLTLPVVSVQSSTSRSSMFRMR